MPRNRSRLAAAAVALALLAILLASPLAAAAPGARRPAAPAARIAQLWPWLAELLGVGAEAGASPHPRYAVLWGRSGSSIDPNGKPATSATTSDHWAGIDPNGSSADVGSSIDPDG